MYYYVVRGLDPGRARAGKRLQKWRQRWRGGGDCGPCLRQSPSTPLPSTPPPPPRRILRGLGKECHSLSSPAASQTIKWKAAAAGREEEGMDVGRGGRGGQSSVSEKTRKPEIAPCSLARRPRFFCMKVCGLGSARPRPPFPHAANSWRKQNQLHPSFLKNRKAI